MGHLTDTLNRYEIKYLVPSRDVPHLIARLGAYLVPDENGDPEWGYSVYSVYWDSPDFRFFWEKVEGLKDRRKLRFRRYGEDPRIFVEIKQRTDRTLQKRRLVWSPERVLAVFGPVAEGFTGGLVEPDDPVAAEVMVLCHRFALRPTVAVRYRRRALLGRYEPGLRVTFDSRIQYRAAGVDLVRPFDVGKYALDPRSTVMEVKFTGRVPLWLVRAVGRNSLQMVRMSKYCSAVDREYHEGQLT